MAKAYEKILQRTRKTFDIFVRRLAGEPEELEPPKPDDKEDVAEYVKQLWEDALNWRKAEFEKTQDQRFGLNDPVAFWKACLQLESGNHWPVWGSRKKDTKDDWKHELVFDEISNDIRVRTAYLTANWHHISISPNIQHISEIIDEERLRTRWSQKMVENTKRMKVLGETVLKSVLDRSFDKRGIANEEITEIGSIFQTPYTTSFKRSEGCWYVVHATRQNLQWVEENYPEFDLKDIPELTGEAELREFSVETENVNKTFQRTKLITILEAWLDDNRQEEIPVDEEIIIQEHANLSEGAEVEVEDSDNDVAHTDAHQAFIEDLTSVQPDSAEEFERISNIAEMTILHMEEHMEQMEEKKLDGLKAGMRRKYEFGRKIVTIGGKLAEDILSPFEFDWRELFHRIRNEKALGRIDGRGDAEILWNTNKAMDTFASRIADIALVQGTPKTWLPLEDKEQLKKEGELSNDPTKPSFYGSKPPIFRQAQASPDNFNILDLLKKNAERQLGVSDVTFGRPPHRQASGQLAETLLRQGEIVISGEPNTNMNDGIEEVIETRLRIMKQFYTEDRWYFINGKMQPINVSRILSVQEVQDPQTGKMKEVAIPLIRVRVKPNSNFPNQWELKFQFIFSLVEREILPREAAIDMLAEKYPEYGRNSPYYRLSKATEIGMQMLEEQEQQAQGEEKERGKIEEALKSKARSQLIKEGGGDGTGEQSVEA